MFTIWITICWVASYAQTIPGQSVSTDIQEEVAKYEQYYEIVLDNALSEYYKKGTFIVDVKANLEKVLVPTEFEVVEGEEVVQIENLPGLPFVPPNLRNTANPEPDSLKASSFDARFRLTRLNVKVLVDTSYSEEDVEFVQEAASLFANADRFRGDIVSVEKKVFPRNARAFDEPQRVEPKPENQEEQLNPIDEQLAGEPGENMFLGIDWNNPLHLLYVMLALGLLFLAALVYAIFKKPKQEAQGTRTLLGGYIPKRSETDIKKESVEPDPKTLSQFDQDKTFLTNSCISTPKLVADLVHQWVASDEEQGMIRAIKSLASVDEKLLKVLEGYLNSDTYSTLKFGIANTDPIPLNERIEEVSSFRRSIQQIKTTQDANDSGSNLFDFVYQLSDQQLLHLMKEESDEMVAILLAQIAGEKAGAVLQKLEDEKRISILLKMGKINNIPISVYKKVASHFSNKALFVSDMKYVAADGIDSILSTIETLPLPEQDKYVQSIAEQDLTLAKKIRKFFIGFDDLPKVKDEFVQAALDGIPTETIVLALRTAPAAVREKVLKVRPKREQQLILSEIDNPTEVPAKEIEEAQKAMLYAVRKKMKSEA